MHGHRGSERGGGRYDEWLISGIGCGIVRRSVARLAGAQRQAGDEGTENLNERKANGCETESTVRGAAWGAGGAGSERRRRARPAGWGIYV